MARNVAKKPLLAALIALAIQAVSLAVLAEPRPPQGAPTAAPAAQAEPEVAPDSPRASMKQFLALCHAHEYEEASRFMDLPTGKSVDAGGLAKRLCAVIDRRLPDLVSVASPHPFGNANDKVSGVDELGTVPGPNGPEPVRVVRRGQPQGPAIWVFSRVTVDRVDVWYGKLDERWLLEKLPEPLLRPGPFEILYWQYLAMLAMIAAGWGLGRLLGFATRKVISKMVRRTAARWDDTLLRRVGPPLTLAWGLGAFALLVPRLRLYEPAEETVEKVIRAGFLVALFWSFLRAIDVAKAYALGSTSANRASVRSLVPLGAQVVKLLVLSAAVVTVLSELGYPVTSLIAGLGIGGIAIALAAQKTVENLFGSLSIGVDQPFRVGDFIRVEDVQGTVETVGLRSTRIRTPDRTLVTIPNGKLADMRIECFTVRDRFRLSTTLSLVHETTSAQLRNILKDIEAALREEESLHKEGVTVAVKGIGQAAVDIEVTAWFDTADLDKFARVRQDLLLRFLEIVEKNGSSLAHPMHTVRLVQPVAKAPG
jgi:MscS family membrane protein